MTLLVDSQKKMSLNGTRRELRRKLKCRKNLLEEKLSIVSALQDQKRSREKMRLKELIKAKLGKIIRRGDLAEKSWLGVRNSRRGEGNECYM